MEATALVFELIYYGLSAGLAAVLLTVAVKGIRLRRSLPDRLRRASALGLVLAAIGAETALVTGVGLDSIRVVTGDLFYQQIHFSIFYVAFALVLYGVDRVASSAIVSGAGLPPPRTWTAARLGVWSGYAGVVGVSVWLLANAGAAATGPTGAGHHVPQQTAFFLPVLLAVAVSTAALASLATRFREKRWMRSLLAWFAGFTALVLIGSLREATIIPSSGEPLVDLLVAFAPFAVGGVCLYLSLRTIPADHLNAAVPATKGSRQNNCSCRRTGVSGRVGRDGE